MVYISFIIYKREKRHRPGSFRALPSPANSSPGSIELAMAARPNVAALSSARRWFRASWKTCSDDNNNDKIIII